MDEQSIPPETFLKVYLLFSVLLAIAFTINGQPYGSSALLWGAFIQTLFGVAVILLPIAGLVRVIYVLGKRFHSRVEEYEER